MRKLGLPVLLMISVALSVMTVSVSAGENVLGLSDTNQTYDLYLQGSDGGASVIKNVEIVDIKTIQNLVFLVINTDTFASKRSQGLIRFDYVQAILPSYRSAQFQGTSQIKY